MRNFSDNVDYGSSNPRVVHTPLRAHYIIFYRAVSVPKDIRSGFLTLHDTLKYVLSHLDYMPDHIYDVVNRKVVWEMKYPNEML